MTDDNDTTDSPSKRPPNRRVKTPTVLQMEATECGAASLGIILGYYGRIVPLEELREICGVSRDGSKAINVIKAARHYGLETHAFTTDPEALREMELPQVLFWNFNHFLVVEGFKGDTVYLNDPALGPRTVSYEELDESFTGVVMTFSPGQDFMQTGRKPSLAAALRRRLVGSEISLLYIILAGLGLVIPGLLVPAFLRVFVDNILVGQLQGWLGPLLLGMGLTLAVTAALTWLREHYLLRLETKLAISTSSHFFWHILRLPIVFFSQRYAGEVGSRVAINDRVAQLLSGELATTVVNMITVFFFLGLMLWYDWLLTLVGVAIVLLNVYALRLVSRRRVDGNRRLLNELGKMQGTAMSGLQTIETIKAGGGESDFFARWAGYQAKVVNAQQELAKFTEILAIVPLFLTDLTVIAILGVGGLRVMDEQMTLGTLVAFQALMLSFVAPFNRLVELGSRLQEAEGDMNRVDDVLRYDIDGQFQPLALGVPRSRGVPPALEVVDAPVPSEGLGTSPSEGLGTSLSGAEGATKLTGHIELRDVAFGYSRLDPPLIENFDLALKPGSRVALVGATGSGKSTAARLIEGLYDPWSGELLFDGRPRSELPRALLTNSLAVVDQEIFLFEGTVRDNLTLWDATISETQMLRAAKDAVIHDVIAARTGGYAGQVAENGRNFSGGERQRLEMARALVGDPSILILDEATSALDPALEQQIDDNIRRRGCTTLIIAHRLSTIRDCDEIIVLDKGKVVERGTHEQMIRRKGPYSRLIKTDALRAEKSRTEALLDSLL